MTPCREGGRGKARREWVKRYGPLPKGINVLHRCDNPNCWRWSHLFLGTQKDNIQDCIRKSRFKAGCKAKLSREIIDRIINSTGSQRQIARQFGVDQTYVSQLKRGLWRKNG